MEKLAQHSKEKLIDLLSERLAFEREAVKLYDAILARLDGSGAGAPIEPFRDELRRFRDEEREHEQWLERQIRELGGEATARTAMALLVERESAGLLEVAANDDLLPHVIHALLAAELVDNSGWELLVELADEADDTEAREEFRRRLYQEADHLLFARAAMLTFARKDLLGYERRVGD